MTDPLLVAARELTDESLAGIKRAIQGAPTEALNWRPAGDDTNTIAVLTVHALHSTRWWLSVANDAPAPERDRPSEFEARASSAEELVSLVDSMSEDCRSLLVAQTFDPGASRTSQTSYGAPGDRHRGMGVAACARAPARARGPSAAHPAALGPRPWERTLRLRTPD